MILSMYVSGRLGNKLNDEQFKSLLTQVTQTQQKKTSSVKFDRRRAFSDDEDEDYE